MVLISRQRKEVKSEDRRWNKLFVPKYLQVFIIQVGNLGIYPYYWNHNWLKNGEIGEQIYECYGSKAQKLHKGYEMCCMLHIYWAFSGNHKKCLRAFARKYSGTPRDLVVFWVGRLNQLNGREQTHCRPQDSQSTYRIGSQVGYFLISRYCRFVPRHLYPGVPT